MTSQKGTASDSKERPPCTQPIIEQVNTPENTVPINLFTFPKVTLEDV